MATTEFITVNAICVLVNVAFFVVVQSLVFWFLSSRELERVMLHTTETIADLRRNLRQTEGQDAVVTLLDGLVLGFETESSRDPETQKKIKQEMDQKNLRVLFQYAGTYLLIILFILVCLLVYNYIKKRPFTWAHWVGIMLVVLAYITEALLIATVIMPCCSHGPLKSVNHAKRPGSTLASSTSQPRSSGQGVTPSNPPQAEKQTEALYQNNIRFFYAPDIFQPFLRRRSTNNTRTTSARTTDTIR